MQLISVENTPIFGSILNYIDTELQPSLRVTEVEWIWECNHVLWAKLHWMIAFLGIQWDRQWFGYAMGRKRWESHFPIKYKCR